MTRPFKLLRTKLFEADINQIYLAELMGRSETYITNRMTCKYPWSQQDMYFIMDLLKITYSEMYIYFPKNGRMKEAV